MCIRDRFGRLGDDALGIVEQQYEEQVTGADQMIDKLVRLWITRRNEARRNKDFGLADGTRAELDNIGIVLEDRPDGTTAWRRK